MLRLLVGVIGTLVVVAGIILIPWPGPGWLIVLAGLGILATEFAWARRLLAYTKARLEAWWQWQARQHGLVRLLLAAALFAVVVGVVWVTLRLTLGVESPLDIWDRIT